MKCLFTWTKRRLLQLFRKLSTRQNPHLKAEVFSFHSKYFRRSLKRAPQKLSFCFKCPDTGQHTVPTDWAFPVSPGDEVACSRARNNPSRTFPFPLFNSPVSNRPFYLVCFVFPIQTTFCRLINYAYTCTWMHVHKTTFEKNSSVGYNHVVWNAKTENIQAKKVYSSWPLNKGTEDICTGSAST